MLITIAHGKRCILALLISFTVFLAAPRTCLSDHKIDEAIDTGRHKANILSAAIPDGYKILEALQRIVANDPSSVTDVSKFCHAYFIVASTIHQSMESQYYYAMLYEKLTLVKNTGMSPKIFIASDNKSYIELYSALSKASNYIVNSCGEHAEEILSILNKWTFTYIIKSKVLYGELPEEFNNFKIIPTQQNDCTTELSSIYASKTNSPQMTDVESITLKQIKTNNLQDAFQATVFYTSGQLLSTSIKTLGKSLKSYADSVHIRCENSHTLSYSNNLESLYNGYLESSISLLSIATRHAEHVNGHAKPYARNLLSQIESTIISIKECHTAISNYTTCN